MPRILAAPALTLALLAAPSAAGLAPAGAATAQPRFANCTAMHKHYPHGVAKPGAVNKGGKITGSPTYNAKLYAANKSLDRDKDGIACEK